MGPRTCGALVFLKGGDARGGEKGRRLVLLLVFGGERSLLSLLFEGNKNAVVCARAGVCLLRGGRGARVAFLCGCVCVCAFKGNEPEVKGEKGCLRSLSLALAGFLRAIARQRKNNNSHPPPGGFSLSSFSFLTKSSSARTKSCIE